MRIFLKLSYDGSKFLGSQQQNISQNTVLDKIINACSTLNIKSKITGSGRTDKGVHANNQIIHLDLPSFWTDLDLLKITLNRHLYPHIHIKQIKQVKQDFHARFSPLKREYRYIFSHEQFNPFMYPYVVFSKKFDINKLNEILAIFKGKHNFEYFKKNGGEIKNFTKEIYKIQAKEYKNLTIISICANSFLRSQIRMIISATLKVYEKKLSTIQIKEQLNQKHIHTQSLAPANGLYLHRIFYKNDIYI